VASNLSRFPRWAKRLMGIVFHQRTELTIVTEQVTIIRPYRATHGWCRECGREVETISLRDADAIVEARVPMLVDSPIHQWHFADALGKLVCLESVLKTSSGFSPKTSSHQITEGEGK
jgi:hypothetical protein